MHRTQLQCEAISLRQTLPKAHFLAGDDVVANSGDSHSRVQQPPPADTPTAPEFASWLARMHAADCKSAVLEFSSQALAERRTSGIQLDAAILTNIQSNSDGEHNSPHAYEKITRRLFRHLKTGGLALVNADDHRSRRLLTDIDSSCLPYAIHREADVTPR